MIWFKSSLADLKSATIEDRNIMPYVITAVENYATLGEVADTLGPFIGFQG